METNSDWIICPSKSKPGKFYYFNERNGQNMWVPSIPEIQAARPPETPKETDNYYHPEQNGTPAPEPPQTPITRPDVTPLSCIQHTPETTPDVTPLSCIQHTPETRQETNPFNFIRQTSEPRQENNPFCSIKQTTETRPSSISLTIQTPETRHEVTLLSSMRQTPETRHDITPFVSISLTPETRHEVAPFSPITHHLTADPIRQNIFSSAHAATPAFSQKAFPQALLKQPYKLRALPEKLVNASKVPLHQRFVNFEAPIISFGKVNKENIKRLHQIFTLSKPINKSKILADPRLVHKHSVSKSSYTDFRSKSPDSKEPYFNLGPKTNEPVLNKLPLQANEPVLNKLPLQANEPVLDGQAIKANEPDLNEQALKANEPDLNGQALKANEPDLNEQALKANEPDLNGQALKANEPDLNGQALKANEPDLNGQALKANEPNLNGQALKANEPDLNGQTVKANEPDLNEQALKANEPDLNEQALKANEPDLNGQAVKANEADLNEQALKANEPDLNGQALKANEPDLNGQAVKANEPDLNEQALKANEPDLNGQALKANEADLKGIKGYKGYNAVDVCQRMSFHDDLRAVLIAKRKSQDYSNTESQGSKPKASKQEAPKKTKKVTFNEDNTKCAFIELYRPILQYLKGLGPSSSQDTWYILADTELLTKELQFIHDFVQIDPTCKLLIPPVVHARLLALARDRACPLATAARNALRRTTSGHVVVQPCEDQDNSMCTSDALLRCCEENLDRNKHVVLISNDLELLTTAKCYPIPCFSLNSIQNELPSKKPLRNEKNIKITIKNDANGISSNDLNDKENTRSLQISDYPIRLNLNSKDKHLNEQKDIPNAKDYYGDENMRIAGAMEMCPEDSENNTTVNTNRPKNETHNSMDIENDTTEFETGKMNTNSQCEKVEFAFENGKTMMASQYDRKKCKDQNGKMNMPIIDGPKSNMASTSNGINVLTPEIMKNQTDLKRFYVKNNDVEERLKARLEEWLCFYTQMMEEALSSVLQNHSSPALKAPPWSLLEALQCIHTLYEEDANLKKIVYFICSCLYEDLKMKKFIHPKEFMKALGCGVKLLECLQLNLPSVLEIQDCVTALLVLLNQIEDDTDPTAGLEEPLLTVHVNSDTNEQDIRPNLKDSSQVMDYLKKHFAAWKDYDSTQDIAESRTRGKNVVVRRAEGKNVKTIARKGNVRKVGNPTKTNKVGNCDKAKLGNCDKAKVGSCDKAKVGNCDKAKVGNCDKAKVGNCDKANVGVNLFGLEKNIEVRKENYNNKKKKGTMNDKHKLVDNIVNKCKKAKDLKKTKTETRKSRLVHVDIPAKKTDVKTASNDTINKNTDKKDPPVNGNTSYQPDKYPKLTSNPKITKKADLVQDYEGTVLITSVQILRYNNQTEDNVNYSTQIDNYDKHSTNTGTIQHKDQVRKINEDNKLDNGYNDNENKYINNNNEDKNKNANTDSGPGNESLQLSSMVHSYIAEIEPHLQLISIKLNSPISTLREEWSVETVRKQALDVDRMAYRMLVVLRRQLRASSERDHARHNAAVAEYLAKFKDQVQSIHEVFKLILADTSSMQSVSSCMSFN